jgi:putative transposase
MLVETYSTIPVFRQCDLVNLARSSFYYQPRSDQSYNEELMRLLDKEYTRHPFYGIDQLTNWLRSIGHPVNRKRVRRLMQKIGIQAIFPKRKTSIPNPEHRIFPYLLRETEIIRPNQVWAADITYIRMNPGWLYLVAVLDWYSRYVVSWSLSNSLDVFFCLEALEQALTKNKPDIFNSDQGAQFTSGDFTGRLEKAGIQISMDGRGRVYDNIYVERLWRTVKYEEVYLHDYQTVREAREQLGDYFRFYNQERFHSSLGCRPPAEVYFGRKDN